MKIIFLALALAFTVPACAQQEKEMSKMDNSANKRLQAAAAAETPRRSAMPCRPAHSWNRVMWKAARHS